MEYDLKIRTDTSAIDSISGILVEKVPEKIDRKVIRDDVIEASMNAFNTMRKKAAMHGFMSDEEIEAEINAARNKDD